MITKYQAEAIVEATSYRDWKIELVDPSEMVFARIMGAIRADFNRALPVNFTYTALDSRPDAPEGATVTNVVPVAIPLTETEIGFARALYEAIGIIEEHERREFFTVGLGVVPDRARETRLSYDVRGWNTANSGGDKEAVFHPHGINRNKLFHDLDEFAKALRLDTFQGDRMTADAV